MQSICHENMIMSTTNTIIIAVDASARCLGLLCQSSRTGPAKEVCDLIFPFVTSETAAVQVLPTAPTLRQPRGGRDWLEAGVAAMVLDPLCGDGTGHSLRTGLLGVNRHSRRTGQQGAVRAP
jgi:hypothetical protein